ncbi:hypothetical protein ZIOFF_000930 [Zingiber officinale]|uniref:Uncharacterized protein n=1 Tax=Zingiber officinale TaxID=94328 RepID=A0A8J5I554_ZINOF|nr:hypothetical protein ZIOFF_000930 [Zingiber officinale]
MPRFIESGAVEERRMFAVRNRNRTPVVALSSPTYTYPDPLKYVKKVTTSVVESPPPEGRKCEERENRQPNFGVHGLFPSMSSFKQYQNAAMALTNRAQDLWRLDKSRSAVRWNSEEVSPIVRNRCGRFADYWGSCERHEKKFTKPENDIPSTAETRAKNKACQVVFSILFTFYFTNIISIKIF